MPSPVLCRCVRSRSCHDADLARAARRWLGRDPRLRLPVSRPHVAGLDDRRGDGVKIIFTILPQFVKDIGDVHYAADLFFRLPTVRKYSPMKAPNTSIPAKAVIGVSYAMLSATKT